jgi:hypothetical protein
MAKPLTKKSTDTKDITVPEPAVLPAPVGLPVGVLSIIDKAVDKLGGEGAKDAADAVVALVNLQRDINKDEARKEFYNDLAAFQLNCPKIPKTRSTKGAGHEGGKFDFKYADLSDIANIIDPIIHPLGFSYTWTSEYLEIGGKPGLKVTCALQHRTGHTERSSFAAPTGGSIGSMNDIQKQAGYLSYLKRYTLLSILGIATADDDNNGVDLTPIRTDELINLRAALVELHQTELDACKYIGVDKLEDATHNDYITLSVALADRKRRLARQKPKEVTEAKALAESTILLNKLRANKDQCQVSDEWIAKKEKELAACKTDEDFGKFDITIKDALGDIA